MSLTRYTNWKKLYYTVDCEDSSLKLYTVRDNTIELFATVYVESSLLGFRVLSDVEEIEEYLENNGYKDEFIEIVGL